MNSVEKMRAAEIVQALISRDGDKCQFPGCKDPYNFSNSNIRTIDHVIPRSKGGPDSMSNFALMHRVCNNIKSDREYLPDGTLEPLNRKPEKIKVEKRPPCDTCFEGRALLAGEVCEVCGSDPQPKNFPKYMQRTPKECDHDDHFCWACNLGFVERKSVLNYLLTGEEKFE